MSEPLEIERKFEILNFKKDMLPPNATEFFVVQDYLTDDGNEVRRVRSTNINGNTNYRMTIKRPTGKRGTRIEIESEITKEQYENYLKEKDPKSKTVKKYRYIFPYEERDIEIDVMVEPFYSKGRVFLEVELEDINAEIKLPSEFEVVERTDDSRYSNHSIAQGLLPN